MDFKDKWQNYFEQANLKCPECGDESEGVAAWRQHIVSQHQQSQSAKNIIAFYQSAQEYALLFSRSCLYFRLLTILL